MGEVKIHYYIHNTIYLKSVCGINWDNMKDYSNNIKYITCKKCLKTWQKHNTILD